MTTFPYSDLLAQVEALAGATLATPERNRVKIFANRRARKAHRECDYWPHLLHVGEERIVSEEGLLPLAQTGLQTIDKIIRIHAEDPFKSQAVYEYTEYYHDASGIQIAGYELADQTFGPNMLVSGTTSPPTDGIYYAGGPNESGRPAFSTNQDLTTSVPFSSITYQEDSGQWALLAVPSVGSLFVWASSDDVASPDLVTTWTPLGTNSGSFTIESVPVYSAFITYLAGIPATYGDGEGEESDVPEPWFEYMAQGAYTDWLRSDGQTEKAMAEEAIAADLLTQQLEKVSRSNGNQVITRVMSHATKQAR
jgi:hypothetical protein